MTSNINKKSLLSEFFTIVSTYEPLIKEYTDLLVLNDNNKKKNINNQNVALNFSETSNNSKKKILNELEKRKERKVLINAKYDSNINSKRATILRKINEDLDISEVPKVKSNDNQIINEGIPKNKIKISEKTAKLKLNNNQKISALYKLINWINVNKNDVENILNLFDTNGDQKSEQNNAQRSEQNNTQRSEQNGDRKVVRNDNRKVKNALSATTFNDYYKWSMLPAIRALEKSQENPINVTFGVNIRTLGYRNNISQKSTNNNNNKHGEALRLKITENLNKLKDRKFDKELFTEIILEKNLNIDSETIDLICGPNEKNPRSLIDEVRLLDRELLTKPPVFNSYGKDKDKVIISFYEGFDQKLEKNRYYIEATGPWHKVTWVETTMTQCVYKTLLDVHLEKIRESYAVWLFASMFRCAASVNSILELEASSPKIIKGALFTGRRTGSYAFMLLQNLYVNDMYSNCIGTSSVDAWSYISKMRSCNSELNHRQRIPGEESVDYERLLNKRRVLSPIGNYSHELSMVVSSLFPNIDKNKYPLTQIVSHYLYYITSPTGSAFSILPETLSTQAFMKIANSIKVKNKKNLSVPFLSLVDFALQDYGTIEGFAKILKDVNNSSNYSFTNNIMASEIEDVKDLKKAFEHPQYKTFGADGFFGDSEKAWYTHTVNISMASKVVRVYLGNKIAHSNEKNLVTYPAKTGNSNLNNELEVNTFINTKNNKLELNTLLNKKEYDNQVNKAKKKGNTTYNPEFIITVGENLKTSSKNVVQSDFDEVIASILPKKNTTNKSP